MLERFSKARTQNFVIIILITITRPRPAFFRLGLGCILDWVNFGGFLHATLCALGAHFGSEIMYLGTSQSMIIIMVILTISIIYMIANIKTAVSKLCFYGKAIDIRFQKKGEKFEREKSAKCLR